MEIDFLATEKFFVQLKRHFSSFLQAKMYIFSLGHSFSSGTKMILFWAEGWGISLQFPLQNHYSGFPPNFLFWLINIMGQH